MEKTNKIQKQQISHFKLVRRIINKLRPRLKAYVKERLKQQDNKLKIIRCGWCFKIIDSKKWIYRNLPHCSIKCFRKQLDLIVNIETGCSNE